jgi:hypothetical protein
MLADRPKKSRWLHAKWLFLLAILALGSLSCSLAGRILRGAAPGEPQPTLDRESSQSSQAPQESDPTNTIQGDGLIAYLGEDGNIYTILPDGTRQWTVTDDASLTVNSEGVASFYQHPTWSQAEQRLAFVKLSVQEGEQNSSLHSANFNGSERVEITQSGQRPPFYLYWSHDGTWLSWLATTEDASSLALRLAPARGGEISLLGTGQPYYWDWSPDDRRIFIHTGGATQVDDTARLAVLTPDSASDRELDLHPAFFQAPAWSPSGEGVLLVAESSDGESSLLLADTSGEVAQVLLPGGGPMAFDWSPDGSNIALLTPSGGGQALLRTLSLIDPQQPQDRRVIAENSVFAFFWSPDGRRLAYFEPTIESPDPTQPTTRTQSDPLRISATLPSSPTQQDDELTMNLHIVDVESGQIDHTISFTPTPEFLNVLPFFDQYTRSAQIWSPNSKYLTFAGIQDGEHGIYTLTTETGAIQRIAQGRLSFWSWQ